MISPKLPHPINITSGDRPEITIGHQKENPTNIRGNDPKKYVNFLLFLYCYFKTFSYLCCANKQSYYYGYF